MEANQHHSSISNSSDAVPRANSVLKRWQIGWLLPRILALIGVVDVFFRCAPAGWRIYDVGERVVRYRLPGEAFERNLKLRGVAAPSASTGRGDLARIGNIGNIEEPRTAEFSTDALGFRNLPDHKPVTAVIFGDSFAIGGDRDTDTLAVKLTEQIGCRVYNSAGPDREFQRPVSDEITSLTKHLGLERGFVILEGVERLMFSAPPSTDSPNDKWAHSIFSTVPGFSELRALSRKIRGEINEISSEINGEINEISSEINRSPLKVPAEEKLRLLKNDLVLPNSYANSVVKDFLRNGDRILFYPDELKTYERVWPINDYWGQLTPELEKSGLKLMVVLVPNKYTVYYRFLSTKHQLAVQPGELLNRIEYDLRLRNIPVINLTKPLQLDAELSVDRHEYNYYREDTHWNPRGMNIAAVEIEKAFPELRASCADRVR